MTHDVSIQTAGPAEAERCLEVLTLAFSSDPPTRWVWPDPGVYLKVFPCFARAFAGEAFTGDGAFHADYRGIALWLGPGVHAAEEQLIDLVRETVPEARREAAFSLFEQMDAWHPPEPHWYLPLVGVDPAFQGSGVGSALLRHALRECDRQQLPAYLEATTPRNQRLYQRHGFEALATLQAGDSPPVVPMLRRPQ